MEPTNTEEKLKKTERNQIILLGLIGVLIFLLTIAIVVLVTNVDEIKSDPVEYAIAHTPIDSCVCFIGDEALDYPRGQNRKLVIQNWTTGNN